MPDNVGYHSLQQSQSVRVLVHCARARSLAPPLYETDMRKTCEIWLGHPRIHPSEQYCARRSRGLRKTLTTSIHVCAGGRALLDKIFLDGEKNLGGAATKVKAKY